MSVQVISLILCDARETSIKNYGAFLFIIQYNITFVLPIGLDGGLPMGRQMSPVMFKPPVMGNSFLSRYRYEYVCI